MTTHFLAAIIERPSQGASRRFFDYQRARVGLSRLRAAMLEAVGLCPEVPLALALAASSVGRVVLHACCVVRRPSHARWHWRGMVRELRA